MITVSSTRTVCKARKPEKCRYHSAVRKMEEALQISDLAGYMSARQQAEKHIYEAERTSWTKTTSVETKERFQELLAFEPPAVHLSKPKTERRVPYSIAGVPLVLIIDDTRSAYMCPECRNQVSYDKEIDLISDTSTTCSNDTCRAYFRPQEALLGVKESSLWLFDSSKFSTHELYHITTREDWTEGLKSEPNLFVHLGSLEATRYRAQDLDNESKHMNNVFYRYTIKLKRSLRFNPAHILKDDNNWETHHSSKNTVLRGREAVYLNRWEDPGSLSVAVTPDRFDVVKMEQFSSAHIWD